MVKDAVPLGECARALVIKLCQRSEVPLAAPVFSVLKVRGVEVDALVYDDAGPMLQGHPSLSQLHLVGRAWSSEGMLARLVKEQRLFGQLRGRSYGLLVHLSEHRRGAWLARALGARYSVGPRVPGRGRLWEGSFTHLFLVAARRDRVELNLDALRRIGIYPEPSEREVGA
jgi:heptosyltransferase-3